MNISRQSLEKRFFRVLNSIVEPAVRRGFASPRFSLGGLIVLESTGFKTGITRRTPLVATHLGSYVLVSTVRGEKSFWVKNLKKEAQTRFYLGGKARDAEAFVMAPGKDYARPEALPAIIGRLIDTLAPLTDKGFAFVLLRPAAAM